MSKKVFIRNKNVFLTDFNLNLCTAYLKKII